MLQFVGGGQQKRAFLDISDGIMAIISIIENREASRNQIFNIGYPENEYSIREVAGIVSKTMQPHISDRDLTLSRISKSISEEEYYGIGYQDMSRRVPSIEKISTLLHWNPTISLEKSIEKIVAFHQEELKLVTC